ncbi:MAG: glycosyltransferase family 2 protein [Campylobacterota bacterium]|nr:glycosyltransferase family 2 protein [Campylobacterota bacterium]
MNQLISIIMPSYGSATFLPAVIDSVLDQTFKEWELIIVDDCSPDNSNMIVEEYMQHCEKIKLVKLENNSGPAVARNRGIKEARGRYIAFLDSDDLWAPEKLSRQLAFMEEHDAALSFTGYYRIEEDSNKVIDQMHVPKKVDYSELLKQNIIGCLTAMYDTKILGKVYMPEILKRQDFALWLDILKKVPCAYGLDEPLAYYRVRTSSLSSNKIAVSKYNWKMYREIEKLPMYKAVYYFGWYTYKSILKYK